MIRVVIAEETPVIQKLFGQIMQTDPDIVVVAIAGDGQEAIRIIKRHKPDILIIDVKMPVLDGMEATRIIMQECPLPIIVTGAEIDPHDVRSSMQALQYGAVAVAEKPRSPEDAMNGKLAARLAQTVRLMAEIKVVRRVKTPEHKSSLTVGQSNIPAQAAAKTRHTSLLAIGASTGGPQALEMIIPAIPVDFSVPIVLVQHITTGFTTGFCDWLQSFANIPVCIASDNQQLLPGHCYIAPEGHHLEVTRNLSVKLSNGPHEHSSRPSISVLFRSVANEIQSGAVAVLLSGMGKDGALEIGLVKERGGTTIAQNNESSLIFGMPGEAIRLGNADYVLSPIEISAFLTTLNR